MGLMQSLLQRMRHPADQYQQQQSTARARSHSFTILTLNTSNATPSSASSSWSQHNQDKGIADLVVQSGADVVCLQELRSGGGWRPHGTSGGETTSIPSLIEGSYTAHGRADSHMGYCQTFLRKGSGLVQADEGGGISTVGPVTILPVRVPAVSSAAKGEESPSQRSAIILVANGHLAPFGSNSSERKRQIQAVVDRFDPSSFRLLVFAGDMNMRGTEDEDVTAMGLSDAWVLAGSDKEKKFTWDTRRNHYYKDGNKYTARYDRIYIMGSPNGAESSDPNDEGRGIQCSDFRIVADKPIHNKRHYLSDHFGILATIDFDLM